MSLPNPYDLSRQHDFVEERLERQRRLYEEQLAQKLA